MGERGRRGERGTEGEGEEREEGEREVKREREGGGEVRVDYEKTSFCFQCMCSCPQKCHCSHEF